MRLLHNRFLGIQLKNLPSPEKQPIENHIQERLEKPEKRSHMCQSGKYLHVHCRNPHPVFLPQFLVFTKR